MEDDFTLPDGAVLPINMNDSEIFYKFGEACEFISNYCRQSITTDKLVIPVEGAESDLRWLHTLFIIGGLVPNLEFSRENVKNMWKNKYNFFSLKSEPQVMFILMF